MPLIAPNCKPHLHAYVGGIVRELGGKAYVVNGTADHIHLLINLPPSSSLSDAVRVIKTNSSRWMKEQKGASKFGWQPGYAAFSVSQSNVDAVKEYIARQEEHHRSASFQEEYVAFLNATGLRTTSGTCGNDGSVAPTGLGTGERGCCAHRICSRG
jgi:hypothetical protein